MGFTSKSVSFLCKVGYIDKLLIIFDRVSHRIRRAAAVMLAKGYAYIRGVDEQAIAVVHTVGGVGLADVLHGIGVCKYQIIYSFVGVAPHLRLILAGEDEVELDVGIDPLEAKNRQC